MISEKHKRKWRNSYEKLLRHRVFSTKKQRSSSEEGLCRRLFLHVDFVAQMNGLRNHGCNYGQ